MYFFTISILDVNGIPVRNYSDKEKAIYFYRDDTDSILIDKIFTCISAYQKDSFLLPEYISLNNNLASEVPLLERGSCSKYLSRTYRTISIEREVLSNSTDALKVSSKWFNELYNTLRVEFSSLTKQGLLDLNKYILFHAIPGFFDSFKRDIDFAISNKETLVKEMISKYSINKLGMTTSEIKEYIDIIETGFDYNISNAIFNIKISENNTPLNLLKIVQEFKLTKSVPFIQYVDPVKKTPIVKHLKKLDPKLFDIWTTKNGGKKIPKGLEFKLLDTLKGKTKSKRNITEYFNSNVSKYSPKITIRCNWGRESKVVFHDLCKSISGIKGVVDQIRVIENKFSSFIISPVPTITFISIHFNIKKKTPLETIYSCINSKYKKVFRIKNFNVNNSIRFVYIPLDFSIYINKNDLVTVKGNEKIITRVNMVTVNGISKEHHIPQIIEVILDLFRTSQTFEKQTKIQKNEVKQIYNIKQLKGLGINTDSIQCQKNRQPAPSSSQSKSKNESYISYKGTTFKCGKEYTFPGFTSGGILCCFKKNQTNKMIYKREMGLDTNTFEFDLKSDSEILSNTVIITDKILDSNRLGVIDLKFLTKGTLQKEVKHCDSDTTNLFRLGVVQNNISFLNCINSALFIVCKGMCIIKRNDLVSFLTKEGKLLFNSLADGEISKKMSISQYTSYISDDSVYSEPQLLIDLVSIYITSVLKLDINIFVIEKSSRKNEYTFIYNSTTVLPRTNSILILKNGKYNELIVRKNKKTLDRCFKESFNLFKMYMKNRSIYYFPYFGGETPTGNQILDFNQIITSRCITITGQILNCNGKVEYVKTKGGLVPIFTSAPKYGIPVVDLSKSIVSYNAQYKLLIDLASRFSFLGYLNVNGVPIKKVLPETKLVTVSNLVVPTKGVKLEYLNYSCGKDSKLDERALYAQEYLFYKDLYNFFRFTVSKVIANKVTSSQKVSDLIKNGEREKLYLLLNELLLHKGAIKIGKGKMSNKDQLVLDKEYYTNFLKKVTLELLEQGKKCNEIMSGSITLEKLNKIHGNYIYRKSEKILI